MKLGSSRRSSHGRLGRFFGVLSPVLLGVTLSSAETPKQGVSVTASCEHRPGKGRVTCDVELESGAGRIAWADVLVVGAPDFAPPLRSRVGLRDARARTERRVRIPVAFVASGSGKGVARFRGRAVVCEARGASGAEACATAEAVAETGLVVGTDVER